MDCEGAPCVSCMGLGLLKELKFLKVFNQNLPSFLTKQLSATFKLQLTWSSISIQTDITVLQ